MNHHPIMFMLAIVVSLFWLNESCLPNKFVIENQLFPGDTPLRYHCRSSLGKDLGVKVINRSDHFEENIVRELGTLWTCDIWYGGDSMKNAKKVAAALRVYQSARFPQCGQLRHWTCKEEGIYVKRGSHEPLQIARDWQIPKRF